MANACCSEFEANPVCWYYCLRSNIVTVFDLLIAFQTGGSEISGSISSSINLLSCNKQIINPKHLKYLIKEATETAHQTISD